MRISILGAPSTNKADLATEILERWPMYEGFSYYHDFGGENDYRKIRDSFRASVDDFIADMSAQQNAIVAGSPVETWLTMIIRNELKQEGYSDEVVIDTRFAMHKALSVLDILFYAPAEVDATDKHVDDVIAAAVSNYEKGKGSVFPLENCPAVIRLLGPRDTWAEQVRLYLKDDGTPFVEEDGTLLDFSELSGPEAISDIDTP